MVWLDRLVTNLELKPLWFGITAVDIFIYLMRCYEVRERERKDVCVTIQLHCNEVVLAFHV